MEINDNKITLSTGKILTAWNGAVGLSPEGFIGGGYDDNIYNPEYQDEDNEKGLTDVELVELSDYMIKQWTDFKTKYAKGR
jgi:hypothetical protein